MTTMVTTWERLKPEMDAKGMDTTALSKSLGVRYHPFAILRNGGSF